MTFISQLLVSGIHLKNLKKDDGLFNIPLFMVDYTEKLLELSS